MVHKLSTNCWRNLFHLWASLDTDATINEVTPLNRAELCEIVVFLHRQVVWICSWMIHRLLTNCRQKLFHLWARLHIDAIINEVIPLNRAELCESIVFYTVKVVWLCSWMIHSLPTNCRQKLFHLWARLDTDATINEVILPNRAELCESVVIFTQSKQSDCAHE